MGCPKQREVFPELTAKPTAPRLPDLQRQTERQPQRGMHAEVIWGSGMINILTERLASRYS
jgi:hypothetical protein